VGAGHDHAHGTEHHGGAPSGLGWTVLDTIVAFCVFASMSILFELIWRAYRDRGVRYNLTPDGEAAVRGEQHPHSGVTVDTSQLDGDV
jgi:hypothetical protein